MAGQPSRTPGKNARDFDADLMPWERQPTETDEQWNAFLRYRDMEVRRLDEIGPSARHWSMIWSWGYRVYQYDLYLARQIDEEMVRYRQRMNERQRTIARVMQQKLAQWVQMVDPATLRPSDAARWMEIATKVERDASGATAVVGEVPDPQPERSLADLVGMDMSEVAALAEELDAEILRREREEVEPHTRHARLRPEET